MGCRWPRTLPRHFWLPVRFTILPRMRYCCGVTARHKKSASFLASIYRIWMLRYVNVPKEVIAALADDVRTKDRRKYIPVVARVNGCCVRTTLLPAGGGSHRLQFNAQLRKASRADVGDVVRVEISIDRGPRELPVPADLRDGLKRHPKAWKAFEGAPPGLRRQIVKWMDSAKGQSTRMRRIEILIDRMLERAILRPQRSGGRAK
jgi:Bacteriocin-protection, YdeI or OmpD-Associated/Domain of unknown function (DUF1905)